MGTRLVGKPRRGRATMTFKSFRGALPDGDRRDGSNTARIEPLVRRDLEVRPYPEAAGVAARRHSWQQERVIAG